MFSVWMIFITVGFYSPTTAALPDHFRVGKCTFFITFFIFFNDVICYVSILHHYNLFGSQVYQRLFRIHILQPTNVRNTCVEHIKYGESQYLLPFLNWIIKEPYFYLSIPAMLQLFQDYMSLTQYMECLVSILNSLHD